MTKYVVKMDYCTMAFTSGTCSLQALSKTKFPKSCKKVLQMGVRYDILSVRKKLR